MGKGRISRHWEIIGGRIVEEINQGAAVDTGKLVDASDGATQGVDGIE